VDLKHGAAMNNQNTLPPRLAKKLKFAERLINQRAFERAERVLSDIQKRLTKPYPLPVHQVEGLMAFQCKRYEAARQIFKSVWERDKRNPVAHLFLGRIYRKLHQPKIALMFLENGVALRPQDDNLRSEQISALLELNREDEASALIDRWMGEGEPGGQLLNAAAGVKRQNGELSEAVDFYRRSFAKMIQQTPGADKSDKDAKASFDVERHEDTLWGVLSQLRVAGVHAFTFAGTLLGLTRDGKLLPFDKDVDIGVPYNEMQAAAACMLANGWREINNSFGLLSPRAFTHPTKGLAIDMFAFFYDEKTNSTQTGFVMRNVPFEWNYLLAFSALELETTDSPHGLVWNLKHREKFLETQYGPGWRYPDPQFASFAGEYNLIDFSYLTQCYAYIRLFKNWQSGSFLKMRVLLQNMLYHKPQDELLLRAQVVVDKHLKKVRDRQENENAFR